LQHLWAKIYKKIYRTLFTWPRPKPTTIKILYLLQFILTTPVVVELYNVAICIQHLFLSFHETELDSLFSRTDLFYRAYFNSNSFSEKEKLVALCRFVEIFGAITLIRKVKYRKTQVGKTDNSL